MRTIKLLLFYLFISNGLTGLWALFFAQSFYTSFPGFGLHWIDISGPYNDHLIRDVGAFFCGIASLAFFSIIDMNDSKIRLTCYSSLVFGVPHLIYHTIMIKMFPTPTDKILGLAALVLAVLFPLIILQKIKGYKPKRWFEQS